MQTVAWEMGLSLGTVKTYIERIHRKLRISNQRELILAVLDVHLRSEASSARESSGD